MDIHRKKTHAITTLRLRQKPMLRLKSILTVPAFIINKPVARSGITALGRIEETEALRLELETRNNQARTSGYAMPPR